MKLFVLEFKGNNFSSHLALSGEWATSPTLLFLECEIVYIGQKKHTPFVGLWWFPFCRVFSPLSLMLDILGICWLWFSSQNSLWLKLNSLIPMTVLKTLPSSSEFIQSNMLSAEMLTFRWDCTGFKQKGLLCAVLSSREFYGLGCD